MQNWGQPYAPIWQQQQQYMQAGLSQAQWYNEGNPVPGVRSATPTRAPVRDSPRNGGIGAAALSSTRSPSPATATQRPPASPLGPGTPAYSPALSRTHPQGGKAGGDGRYASPSPMKRSAHVVADSRAYHLKGYTSPAPHQQSPPRRAASPAVESSLKHNKTTSRGPSPMRGAQETKRPPGGIKAAHPMQTAYCHPAPSSQDQIKHYRNQVQELKHAIQAHASSMGVQVSTIMDRCVAESDMSNDKLLLQETRLQALRDRGGLLQFQNKIASLLTQALGDQEVMLRRVDDSSRCKLARIQDVINTSHARISIMGAMLPTRILPISTQTSSAVQTHTETIFGENARHGASNKLLQAQQTGASSPNRQGGRARQEIVAKPSQIWETSESAHVVGKSPSRASKAPTPWAATSSWQAGHVMPNTSDEETGDSPRFTNGPALGATGEALGEVAVDALMSRLATGRACSTCPEPPSSPVPRESLGILLHDPLDARRPHIKFVTPGSPAARAGIKEGEALVSIESQEVVGLPLHLVCSQLAAVDADTITLVLASNGGTSQIRTTRIHLSRRCAPCPLFTAPTASGPAASQQASSILGDAQLETLPPPPPAPARSTPLDSRYVEKTDVTWQLRKDHAQDVAVTSGMALAASEQGSRDMLLASRHPAHIMGFMTLLEPVSFDLQNAQSGGDECKANIKVASHEAMAGVAASRLNSWNEKQVAMM